MQPKQPSQVRLPLRSALVRGRVDRVGQPIEKLDQRTATQDPNIEKKKPRPAAN